MSIINSRRNEKKNEILDYFFNFFEGASMRKILFMILISIGAFFGLGILLGSCTTIDSGNIGLKFTMGELQNEELGEGPHLKWPFIQTIREVTIQPIEQRIDIAVNENGAITKDNQTVGTSMTLFYKYRSGNVANLYRQFGFIQIEEITKKTSQESFKKIIGQYTIFDIAAKQQEIISKVFESIKSESLKYPIDIVDLKITNFDWSEQFDKQIEDTMKKAQEVKQKEQELLITEQEANKRVKEANATKIALIAEAEGKFEAAKLNALAKEKDGEGIRKYNEQIAKTLEIELAFRKLKVEQTNADKWNGVKVPTYWYAPIPIQKWGGE